MRRDEATFHFQETKRLRMRAGDYWKARRNAQELAECGLAADKQPVVPREPRPFEQSVAFDLKRQDGIAGRPRPKLCEVCGRGGTICFDHCHATVKFRGWLCSPCNTALGMAKDNPTTLRALADYLERFAKN